MNENVTLALRIIDRLLADPLGSQMWGKEVAMLFRLISVQEAPPMRIKSAPKERK